MLILNRKAFKYVFPASKKVIEMKLNLIIALLIALALTSTLASADFGASIKGSMNSTAIATSANISGKASVQATKAEILNNTKGLINKTRKEMIQARNQIRNHTLLISPNPIKANSSFRANAEVKIKDCVADLKAKYGNQIPAVELRYICEARLRIPHMPGMYVARNVHSEVWDCIANLTMHTNETMKEIRKECFSQFINKKLAHANNGTVQAELNASLSDPMFRHEIVASIVKNRNLAKAVLANKHLIKKIINLSNTTNKTEVKQEIRTFLKEKELRRAFLARLKEDKKLLQNKTIIASFLPDNMNLNRTKIEKIELPNTDTVIVRVSVHAKFLGLIPAHYSQEIINNGTIKVKRPFWAFLFRK